MRGGKDDAATVGGYQRDPDPKRRGFFSLGPADAQPANQSVGSAVAALAGLLVERGECTGIAVGTNHRGTQGFYAYGEVARGSGRLPTPATEFEIGSITKVFTTTLLAIYTQRQSIRFDAPLQNYLPRGSTVPSFGARRITLVDLATHTSGRPRQPPMQGESYSRRRDVRVPCVLPPQTRAPRNLRLEPRRRATRARAGAGATARLAGKRVAVQEITTKLRMPDTRLKLDDEERARLGSATTGQDSAPKKTCRGVAGIQRRRRVIFDRIATCSVSSPGTWARSKLRPQRFVDDPQKPRFALPRPVLVSDWPGDRAARDGRPPVVWKNGGTLGYSSYIGFVPGARFGIVLLANSAHCPVTRAGYQILATLNGQAGETNAPEEGN